jgi:GT2 family glycosyltransferase
MAQTLYNLKAILHFGDIWLIARSRIFDPYWYIAEYPECDPKVLSPSVQYLIKNAISLLGRIIDASWYRTAHSGWDPRSLGPIVHYVLDGARQGFRPHLLFDPNWYRSQAGRCQRFANPLIDYIKCGSAQGLEPSPYFSTRYYRRIASENARLTPLGQFIAHGISSGIIPTPLFDRAWYLENNPDVRQAGLDPFLHFVASGSRNGRSPSPLFDAAWYRMKNPDMRDEGMEPLAHYLAIGASQGRDPSPFFDTAFYLAQAADSSITPQAALADYAESGRTQWRSTHKILPPPSSPAAYFEDFPWEKSTPPLNNAFFRILVIDISGIDDDRSILDRRISASLCELPQIDVFVVTDAAASWKHDQIAVLDLADEALAWRETSVVLERLLRALKFRDANALVIEVGNADTVTASLCTELGLTYEPLDAAAALSPEQSHRLLQERIGYHPAPRPAISVIVPNFNHARYLDERIGSILAQRYGVDEIIILDDCSSDDSPQVIRSWQEKSRLPIILLSNETNSGSPFKQWAKGISRAKGDLVWIAESDDSSHPRFTEYLAASFTDPDVVLAYSDSEIVGPQGDLLSPTYRFYTDTLDGTKWLSSYVEAGSREIETALCVKNTIPNVSAVLFRREAIAKAIPSIEAYLYCGDWAAYVECLRHGKIAYCPRALNRHRQDPKGVTQGGERAERAIDEALAIKAAIYGDPSLTPRSLWMSLAQTIFEYELRSLTLEEKRPPFTENEALTNPLERLFPALRAQPLDATQIMPSIEALAACAINLDKAGRINLRRDVTSQLETIAARIDAAPIARASKGSLD